jgi:hypothetical protein
MLKTIKLVTSALIVLAIGAYFLDSMDVAAHYRVLFGFVILGFLFLVGFSESFLGEGDYK